METISPPQPKISPPTPKTSPKGNKPPIFFILLIGSLLILFAKSFDDFVIKTPDDNYEISPERLEDLKKRKNKIDNAEQYALKAKVNGWYPCVSCGAKDKIYLYIGDIWKYGVSLNGKARYKVWWYREMQLVYIPQFRGTIAECRKEELEKIYRYPLLPENLKRTYKLPRPPGNKEDY